MTLEEALELDLVQRMTDFANASTDEDRLRIVTDFKRMLAQYLDVRSALPQNNRVEGWLVQ